MGLFDDLFGSNNVEPVVYKPRKAYKRKVHLGYAEGERRVKAFIERQNGKPFSMTDLAKGIGVRSYNTAWRYLSSLMEKGEVHRIGEPKRSKPSAYYVGTAKPQGVSKPSQSVYSDRFPESQLEGLPEHVKSVQKDTLRQFLRYIEPRQGRFMSLLDMSKNSGMSATMLGRCAMLAEHLGILEVSSRVGGRGRRYRLKGAEHVPDSAKAPQPEAPKPEPKPTDNGTKMIDVLEPLMWDYIKSAKNTDLLGFLGWLQDKK